MSKGRQRRTVPCPRQDEILDYVCLQDDAGRMSHSTGRQCRQLHQEAGRCGFRSTAVHHSIPLVTLSIREGEEWKIAA